MKSPARTTTNDISDTHVSVVPTLPHAWAAAWAGGRDGRRGITPDPESGITPYLHTIASINATMVESERLRTQTHLAPIDHERALQVERRDRATRQLEELGVLTGPPAHHTPPAALRGPEPDLTDPVAAARTQRAREATVERLLDQVAAATEQISTLDEARADRVTVGALRIQRCTERAQNLCARYWRALARRHPELPELRAAYGVPTIPIPPHPLGL